MEGIEDGDTHAAWPMLLARCSSFSSPVVRSPATLAADMADSKLCCLGWWLGLGFVLATAGTMRAAPASVDYVIQISVDGLSALLFQPQRVATPERYPNFDRLRREGASTFNARCDYFESVTVPNHVSMITGRPVLQPDGKPPTVHHGCTFNSSMPGLTIHNQGNSNLSYIASVFDVVHDHGRTTALYVGKSKLAILGTSYDAVNGAADKVGDDNGRNKVDIMLVTEGDSAALLDDLVGQLTNAPPHYTFLHLGEPDAAGHAYGWGSDAWFQALAAVDGHLGRLLNAITASATLSNHTVIILTADHGGSPDWGHGLPYEPLDYTIPFFVWGPGWTTGADLYDLLSSNRGDPSGSYVDYNAIPQPLHNGDAPNLALSVLGLPAIPGSFMLPQVAPPLPRLAIRRRDGDWELAWPRELTNVVLLSRRSLNPNELWEIIPGDFQNVGGETVFRLVGAASDLHPRFFKLQWSSAIQSQRAETSKARR